MRSRLRILVISVFSLLTVVGGLHFAQPVNAAPGANTYLVRFTDGTNARAEAGTLRQSGATVTHVWENVFPGVAVTLPDAAAAALAKNPKVKSVELDGVVRSTGTQTGATWGLDRIDQRTLPLSGSYTYPDAVTTVRAYIVDTGIRSDHTEFTGRIDPGYSAIADGGGTEDCAGHGTHVAGTVAGTTYGVAKTARLTPVRVLDCAGSGAISGVISGLDWLVADHAAGVPAVANMSLGGGASSTLDAAVQRVIDDGVSMAVAAGNSNVDACTTSPARVAAALTIGATTNTDGRASFSNFGKCVDLFAPGVSITSSYSTSSTATTSLSGTSMASPHVAGAAALILAGAPTLTPAQVAAQLAGTATAGIVTSAGTNSPNLLLYVSSTPVTTPTTTAPSAPTGVTATAAKRAASVSWTKGSDGGSVLTKQTVLVYKGTTLIGSVTVAATATSATITGLTGGTSYSFSVNATNAVGTSPESTRSNTVTALR
jgi:subtilisin family serine protease